MSLREQVSRVARRAGVKVKSGFDRFLTAIRWKLVWERIAAAGLTHWLGVLAALLLGLLASHRLQREPSWQQVRYFGHHLIEQLPSDKPSAARTVVVMIDDAEYESRLNGTSPIDREYLADLVKAVRDAAPQVIALDVALTKPKTGDPFAGKTLKLSQAIASVPKTTNVVLTFRVAGGPERYTREVGLLDGLSNVIFGCVTLTRDKTRLGLAIPLEDRKEHDTFATAIARAVDPEAIRARQLKAQEGSLVTTFLDRDAVPVVRAAEVYDRKAEALAKLAHKIVIIGGNWHDSATGKMVDAHDTPLGRDWSGAVLNANYVEALLAPNATKKPMSDRFDVVMEILATLAVSLIFVVVRRGVLRLITLLLVVLGVITLSVIIFQNFGGFFDCSVVLFFLGIHALLERSGSPHSQRRRWFAFATAALICIAASYFLYRQSLEPVAVFDIEDVAQVAKLTITGHAEDLDIEPPPPAPPPMQPVIGPNVQEAHNEPAPRRRKTVPQTEREILVRAKFERIIPPSEENEIVVTRTDVPVDIATTTSPAGTQVPQFWTLPSSLVHNSAHGIADEGQLLNLQVNGASGAENAYILDTDLCAPERTTQQLIIMRPLESLSVLPQTTMRKDVGIRSFAPLRNEGWDRDIKICAGIK